MQISRRCPSYRLRKRRSQPGTLTEGGVQRSTGWLRQLPLPGFREVAADWKRGANARLPWWEEELTGARVLQLQTKPLVEIVTGITDTLED